MEVCKEKRCQLHVSVEPANVVYNDGKSSFSYLTYKDVTINSPAFYSIKDACIAIETVRALLDTYPVTPEEVANGLLNTFMPVRMEVVSKDPLIIIDGSHNPEGISNMVISLAPLIQNRNLHIIFACFKDKNIERMLAYLGEYSKDVNLTTFPNKRARLMEDYFLYLDDYKFNEDPLETINQIKAEFPNDAILITGSLAFAAYMKNLIK